MEDCVFCKMALGEIPIEKICENDNFFAFFDQNQDIKGHALVIPKKHFETVLDLHSTLGSELIDCIKKTSIKLMDEFEAEGFNVVQNNYSVAGQVVKHVHFHILPRKKDDGVKVIK